MPRVRTFIALDPGQAVKDRIIALQENLARTGADVKWVGPANLHLTLLFLGEVDDRELVAVCAAIDEASKKHKTFDLAVEGTGCFPNIRRPHVVWIGAGQGSAEACALHHDLEDALFKLGCYRREDRAFTPHITLGRIRGDKPMDALIAALTKKKDYSAGETVIREVLVMSSDQSANGPVYTVMSRAKLGERRGVNASDSR
jgi:2'-5' RNA ligase